MAALGLNLTRLGNPPPAALAGAVTPESASRHADYGRAKTRFEMAERTAMLALLLAFVLLGGFGAVDRAATGLAHSLGLGQSAAGLLFLGGLGLLADLAALPWDVYHIFVIETTYGFNTTTPGTFVADKLKGWLVGVLIGGPLAAGVLALFRSFGPEAWLWCWGAAAAWLVLMTWIGPRLLLPLFHRFTPLPEGELRTRIEDYAEAQGIRLGGIQVMDGSRRSTKANAFFTGIGPTKRIALFDTLLDKLDSGQVVAVLAHETGHLKLRHVPLRLAAALAKTGALFWLLSLVLVRPELARALGAEPSTHMALAAFGLLLGPVNLILSLLENALSRAHEKAADRFAARTGDGPGPLNTALLKLTTANLSLLDPHPWFVWLNMSHPPLARRLAGLSPPLAPVDGLGHTVPCAEPSDNPGEDARNRT